MAELKPLVFTGVINKDTTVKSLSVLASLTNINSSIQGLVAFASVAESNDIKDKIAADTDRDICTDTLISLDTVVSSGATAAILPDTALKVVIDAAQNADTARGLLADVVISGDTIRELIDRTFEDLTSSDTDVCVLKDTLIASDTDREIYVNEMDVVVKADTRLYMWDFDRMRLDTHRSVGHGVAPAADSYRKVDKDVLIEASTKRLLPFNTTFAPADTKQNPFFPVPQKAKPGTVSIKIVLEELTLTDTFELETTVQGIDVFDAISGRILDYDYSFCASKVQQENLTRNITGGFDVDRILYTPISYNTEGKTKEARDHAGSIAAALGKSLNFMCDDFTPSSSYTGYNETYSNLISAIFGWTSQIPTKQINVFMRARDNSLNVVQRGRESSVTDLTETKHTRPKFTREVVHTTWSYASSDGSGLSTGGGLYVEPTAFSGMLTIGDSSCTYMNGLMVSEKNSDGESTYSYIGSKETGYYLERKTTSHNDGGKTEISYSYASAAAGNILGEENEVHTDDKGSVTYTRRTTHAPLGSGFYGTMVYENGQYISSSISTGSVGGPVSVYTQNQEALVLGGAKYETGSDYSSESLLNFVDFPIEEKDYKKSLTNEIKSLNMAVKETVCFELYEYDHVVDFTERVRFRDKEYFLVSNEISQSIKELKQTITMVRWEK